MPTCTDIAVFNHEFEYVFSMQLRYNYRLDPWPRHRAALGKAFGCARVVFNDALRTREAAHQAGEPYVTDSALSARLTAIKKAPESAWLNEVSSVVLQQALAELNMADKTGTPFRRSAAKQEPTRSHAGTRRGRRNLRPSGRSGSQSVAATR